MLELPAGRPRPLADAPVDALVARAPEIARDWLIVTLADSPLEAIATVPAADFARDAPAVCTAIARALASDAELGGLDRHAATLDRLTGAPSRRAATVERLRRALWPAALAALEHPGAELVGHLADRLAHVCATLAAGSRAETAAAGPGAGAAPVLSDMEHVTPLELLSARLEAARAAGAQLALVLVELEDAGRLALVEGAAAPGGTLPERVLDALRGGVRASDDVLAEGDGRVWLVLAGAGRAEADRIAARMAEAVRALGSWRGAPLLVSTGVSVHPGDGTDAESLAAIAEEGVFASSAGGVRPPRF